MKYFVGIDVGAASTKGVIIDSKFQFITYFTKKSGVNLKDSAITVYEQCLRTARISRNDIKCVVSTGYGRYNVPFATVHRTEIACHSKGAFFYFPKSITVVDIGGQDSKVIKLDEKGHKISFKMNRKCAAGTGAFLEEISTKLGVAIDELNVLASNSTKDIEIGSYCTVFACTELLSRIRYGEKREDLAKGAFASVVKRVIELDPLEGDVVLTGGVVEYNKIVVELFEKQLNKKVEVPPQPQLIGALGAALFGLETIK
jgi:predicted CoA-substrate-specific enzyme activase